MSLTFLMKLASAGMPEHSLEPDDQALLLSLCANVQAFPARRDIVREGENPEHVLLMVEGWAMRYKVVADGGRQITAFLLPGDFCDAHITLFDRMDHSIAALNACKAAVIPKARMAELLDRPRIARALWWASLVDEAVLRSWIVNLGRRNAFDRVGNLLCELHARLNNVGLVQHGAFALPLTQEELADATGLTSVHINRTLKRLRLEGQITFAQGRIVISNPARLQALVGFEADYLHLPLPRPAAAIH